MRMQNFFLCMAMIASNSAYCMDDQKKADFGDRTSEHGFWQEETPEKSTESSPALTDSQELELYNYLEECNQASGLTGVHSPGNPLHTQSSQNPEKQNTNKRDLSPRSYRMKKLEYMERQTAHLGKIAEHLSILNRQLALQHTSYLLLKLQEKDLASYATFLNNHNQDQQESD